jgi:hypothetical protein
VRSEEGGEFTWNRRKATIVGGWAEMALEKSKERRRGGAWRKAGKSARMVKICTWEMRRNLVG